MTHKPPPRSSSSHEGKLRDTFDDCGAARASTAAKSRLGFQRVEEAFRGDSTIWKMLKLVNASHQWYIESWDRNVFFASEETRKYKSRFGRGH